MMTVQNGLGADEIVGAPRRLADPRLGHVHERHAPLRHARRVHPRHGDVDRPEPRHDAATTPRAVAELIRSSGLKAEAFDDLRPAQWSKLIFNATVNAVAALTGLPHEPRFAAARASRPTSASSCRDLMDEGKAVAAAAGVALREDPWEMNVHATRRGSRHYPSMLEDVEAHRPTEIELITGALVREGERHGVPVPLHTALYRLVKAKEASWRHEGLRRRLRRGRLAVRRQPGDARRRRGLGLRPRTRARRRDQPRRAAADRRRRRRRPAARDDRRGRAARLRLRHRRDEGDAHRRRDRRDRARLRRRLRRDRAERDRQRGGARARTASA